MMLNFLPRDDDQKPAPQMSLTPDLVALTITPQPDLGWGTGWTPLSEDELDALALELHRQNGDAPLWVFAYGSLIWKPEFDAIGDLHATAFGWHRSFCMKISHWRGTPEQPGLMMALERGGRCDGIIYRLPDEERVLHIRRMLHREIRFRENIGMARWIQVHTPAGKKRVLVFWAGPTGERIASRLPLDEVARILARACGPGGSCAEYLFNTVMHLYEYGIQDHRLWRLQELVAEEIRQIHYS